MQGIMAPKKRQQPISLASPVNDDTTPVCKRLRLRRGFSNQPDDDYENNTANAEDVAQRSTPTTSTTVTLVKNAFATPLSAFLASQESESAQVPLNLAANGAEGNNHHHHHENVRNGDYDRDEDDEDEDDDDCDDKDGDEDESLVADVAPDQRPQERGSSPSLYHSESASHCAATTSATIEKNWPRQESANSDENTGSTTVSNDISSTNNYVRSLPKFAGDPRDWLYFKEVYKATTQLNGYSTSDNLFRLAEALEGQARDSVEILLYCTKDPNLIMEMLELQFGNKFNIADKIMADIKSMPSLAEGNISLFDFASKLNGAVYALSHTRYIQNPDLVGIVGNKLPEALKYSFNRYLDTVKHITDKTILEKLASFIYDEAQLAMSSGIFDYQPPPPPPLPLQQLIPNAASTPIRSSAPSFLSYPAAVVAPAQRTRESLEQESPQKFTTSHVVKSEVNSDNNNADSNRSPRSSFDYYYYNSNNCRERAECVIHHYARHDLSMCKSFRNESVAKRWLIVRENNLCFKCFGRGHSKDHCDNRNCCKCKQKHHILLH